MPTPRVINTTRDEPEAPGINQFFSHIQKAYAEKNDNDTVGRILKESSKNYDDVNYLRIAHQKLAESNIPPSRRLQEIQNLGEIEKSIAARTKATQEKMSDFDKTLQKESAKEAAKLQSKIPEYDDIITNLDEIESIAEKNLKGPVGYAKGVIGTESSRRVENLSASTLSGVIKTFNPAGTLPTQKLNWLRDTFAVNGKENLSSMKGKIGALKTLTKQSKARDEKKLMLMKQYKGLIPAEVEQKFNQETSDQNDAVADELAFKMKVQDLKDDESVSGLYDANTGEKLTPIPKKEAIELFSQGLITNVPP